MSVQRTNRKSHAIAIHGDVKVHRVRCAYEAHKGNTRVGKLSDSFPRQKAVSSENYGVLSPGNRGALWLNQGIGSPCSDPKSSTQTCLILLEGWVVITRDLAMTRVSIDRRRFMSGVAGMGLPALMPASIASALAILPEVTEGELSVPQLARELALRCADFRRLDALYDHCELARLHWNDAYFGTIETAHWVHLAEDSGTPAEAAVRSWVASIFLPDIERAFRIEPDISGLSPRFQELQTTLTEALIRLGQASGQRMIGELDTSDPLAEWQWQEQAKREVRKAAHSRCSAAQAIKMEDALTQGDRIAKRRAIEQDVDDGAVRMAHARQVAAVDNPMTRAEFSELLTVLKSQRRYVAPFRQDIEDWAWVYDQ